jgi:hypothetical protein
MKRSLLALLTVAAASAQAASHIVPARWSEQGSFEHQGSIAPGKFIEVCDKLAQGQQIRWRFETAGPTDFNIHFHKGKETVYPAQRSAVREGADTLAVEANEAHCWMWTNKGSAPVALKLRLER